MLDIHDTGDVWRVMRIAGGLRLVSYDGGGLTGVTVLRDNTYREIWRLDYKDFESLPERTRVNVACLRMCAPHEKIKGIGQRVSGNTYWLDESPEIIEEYGDVV